MSSSLSLSVGFSIQDEAVVAAAVVILVGKGGGSGGGSASIVPWKLVIVRVRPKIYSYRVYLTKKFRKPTDKI